MPLSNPTLRAEAIPADVLEWTDGRALIGTGSPFAPVPWHGEERVVPQVNNVYVFPGIGVGVIASGAREVTDAMVTAACLAVAAAGAEHGALVPPIEDSPEVARRVALAVAEQAIADGVAGPQELATPRGARRRPPLDPRLRLTRLPDLGATRLLGATRSREREHELRRRSSSPHVPDASSRGRASGRIGSAVGAGAAQERIGDAQDAGRRRAARGRPLRAWCRRPGCPSPPA